MVIPTGNSRDFCASFGPERVRETPVSEARWSVRRRCWSHGHAAAGEFKKSGRIRVPMVVKLNAGQGVVHPQLFEAWLMSVAGLRVVAHLRRRTIYGMMRAAAPGPTGRWGSSIINGCFPVAEC